MKELIHARQSVVVHAKAYGLQAIDMVYINFKGISHTHISDVVTQEGSVVILYCFCCCPNCTCVSQCYDYNLSCNRSCNGTPFVNLLFILLSVVFFVICLFIYDNSLLTVHCHK